MEENKTKQKIVVEKNLLKTTGDGRWSAYKYDQSEENYKLRPFNVTEDKIDGGYYTVIKSEGKYLLGQRSIFRRRHNGPIALPYRQKGFNDFTFIGGGNGTLHSGEAVYKYALDELKDEALGNEFNEFIKGIDLKKDSSFYTLQIGESHILYHVIELSKEQLNKCFPLFNKGLESCADDEFSSLGMYSLEKALNFFIPNKIRDIDNFEFAKLYKNTAKQHNEIVEVNIQNLKKFKGDNKEELLKCLELILGGKENDWGKIKDAHTSIHKILNDGIEDPGFSNYNALQTTTSKAIEKEWLADKKPRDWHYYFLELYNYAEENKIWE